MTVKRRVWYYYDDEIGSFYFGPKHPMKPQGVRMAHSLIVSLGWDKKMACFRPEQPLTAKEMTKFHSDEYIRLIENITPSNQDFLMHEMWKFNIGLECPVIHGLFEYAQVYSTGSVACAKKLATRSADVAINWAGGMHLARKSFCCGFSPVNDVVLAILELLRTFDRVLYISLDAEHCTGVEEAFYTTNRVVTVSFHEENLPFDDNEERTSSSFSTTNVGSVADVGEGKGRGYALNFPLKHGLSDGNLESLFKPVLRTVIERYQPRAIVYQTGANGLSQDRLKNWNLSVHGYGRCTDFLAGMAQELSVPLLVLGGCTTRLANASRLFAHQSGVLLGELSPCSSVDPMVSGGDSMESCTNGRRLDRNVQIPAHDAYFSHYGPSFELTEEVTNQKDMNSKEYLEELKEQCIRTFKRYTDVAPKVAPPPISIRGPSSSVFLSSNWKSQSSKAVVLPSSVKSDDTSGVLVPSSSVPKPQHKFNSHQLGKQTSEERGGTSPTSTKQQAKSPTRPVVVSGVSKSAKRSPSNALLGVKSQPKPSSTTKIPRNSQTGTQSENKKASAKATSKNNSSKGLLPLNCSLPKTNGTNSGPKLQLKPLKVDKSPSHAPVRHSGVGYYHPEVDDDECNGSSQQEQSFTSSYRPSSARDGVASHGGYPTVKAEPSSPSIPPFGSIPRIMPSDYYGRQYSGSDGEAKVSSVGVQEVVALHRKDSSAGEESSSLPSAKKMKIS